MGALQQGQEYGGDVRIGSGDGRGFWRGGGLRCGGRYRFRRGGRYRDRRGRGGHMCGRSREDVGREGVKVQGELLRQAQPVFRVPAGVVGGVEHPAPPLGLELLPLLVGGDGYRLIIGEEEQVGPLLDQGRGLLLELQLPAVVGPHLVGLFKFAHHGMGGEDHMNTPLHHLLQEVEEPAELLGEINIPSAVAQVLNAADLLARADTADAELFRPVGGVDDQGLAQTGMVTDVAHLLQEHGPAGGLLHPGDIHVPGRALGVDEHGAGEPGGEGALPDALRAVDNGFQGSRLFSGDNLH